MKYGRYEIIREVGHGAMGVVYQALDPHIHRTIAVKVLRPDRQVSDLAIKRFMKEAIVVGRLSHAHIATLYDIGEENGTVYLAMEFLEGKSLSEIIKEKQLAARDIVEYGIQIAEALDYAHHKGVIHRDIKPGNIIVQPDNRIKITDFGVAHMDDASVALQTQTGEIMGTPAYMSPEQVLGKPVDGRSDLYSLGVILYELSTGKRPFGGEGKTLATIFNEILQTTPAEPRASAPPVPSVLSGLIMKALHKQPEKRFQTGKELAAALKNCLGAAEPARAPGQLEAAPGKAKKRKRGALVAVLAVLIALTIGVYLYSLNRSISPPRPSADHVPAAAEAEAKLDKPAPAAAAAEAPAPQTRPAVPQTVQPASPAAPVAAQSSEVKRAGQRPPAPDAKPSTPPRSDPLQSKHSPEAESKKQPPASAASRTSALLTPLKLRSTPQGASVYIDGILKGATPLTVVLPVGPHRVRVSAAGYEDMEKQITVEELMEYPLTFNLISNER